MLGMKKSVVKQFRSIYAVTQSRSHAVTIVFLMSALLLIPTFADACPACKEAFFDPGQLTQKLSTARAYALSIGLLLAMPAGLLSLITCVVFRAYRRQRRLIAKSCEMFKV